MDFENEKPFGLDPARELAELHRMAVDDSPALQLSALMHRLRTGRMDGYPAEPLPALSSSELQQFMNQLQAEYQKTGVDLDARVTGSEHTLRQLLERARVALQGLDPGGSTGPGGAA